MKRLALVLPVVMLAACKQQAPEPKPTPTPTVAVPHTLVAADFDTLQLGARYQGVVGSDAETVLSAGNHEIGTMVSYVACPKGTTECLPAKLPEGTVYTFVHQITLAEEPEGTPKAKPSSAASGSGDAAAAGPTLFRTTLPAPAFNHAIGYSRKQAAAALGSADAIEVSSDGGQLIWRVTKGEGWKPETTITFWWTSTKPPLTLENAYALKINGETAMANAPFPAEDKPVEDGTQP